MTCDVPHVSKAVGGRGSLQRHEAYGGVRSFTQDISELKIIRTETTIGGAAARFGL
jgi:hypothetical protein